VSCARRSPDKTTKDPGSIPGTSTARSPKAPFLKRDGAFNGIMALGGSQEAGGRHGDQNSRYSYRKCCRCGLHAAYPGRLGERCRNHGAHHSDEHATVTSNSRTAMSLFTDASPVAVVRTYGL
jgi:hypothetical protein